MICAMLFLLGYGEKRGYCIFCNNHKTQLVHILQQFRCLSIPMYGVSPYMGSWQDTGSFLDSEGLVMSFVGEGEHLLVASAVAKCLNIILRAVER